jgi:hypothetical protein
MAQAMNHKDEESLQGLADHELAVSTEDLDLYKDELITDPIMDSNESHLEESFCDTRRLTIHVMGVETTDAVDTQFEMLTSNSGLAAMVSL